MGQRLSRCTRWMAVLLFPVLVWSACNANPTAEPLPPTASQPVAMLQTIKMRVTRDRGGTVREVAEDESVDVLEQDRISVNEQGRAWLTLQDRLRIELFRDTEIAWRRAHFVPDDSDAILVSLQQFFGHTRLELESLVADRVKLETEYATITLYGDTEVAVCHAPELTCMVTLKGEAEVEAQGQVRTVKTNESTFVLPGRPPEPIKCADPEQLRLWLDGKRGTEEIEALGALVSRWPQGPCTTPAQVTTPSATLPPVVTTQPDGVEPPGMVRIEGGRYVVGGPEADDYHVASQEIDLPGFWIDEHEVTNGQYQEFIGETGNTPPVKWPGKTNYPVEGVTWEEAAAYCAWAQKRLPAEAEWEVAARGPGPTPPLYPWGPDPSAGGQTFDLPPDATYEVGSQPFNQSPVGVYDMAGNVWEWVGEPYVPVPDDLKILRGGRYGFLRDMAYRQETAPNDERFVALAGFRCAAD